MDRSLNVMESMPIRRLVLHMSWPMMLSMLIQALYNMVDSLFVAEINTNAFVALSLVFPIQSFIVAVQVGTGAGINTLLARRLGEKRHEDANRVAAHGYFLYFLCWIAFAVVGWGFARPFMEFYSDVPQVVDYGVTYLRIVTLLSIGSCMQFASERVLQAVGNSVGPMLIQGVGAVANLILDPIFIFGLFGLPRMEVAGAALATGLGQIIGMCLGLWMVPKVKELQISFRGFRPSGPIIREIYRIGLPAIVMQSLFPVLTLGLNKILDFFSATGVFVAGAYFKVEAFAFMPIFGINNGLSPVVSYNYGARRPDRIRSAIRFALLMAATVMVIGMLVFELFPAQLLQLFQADEAALRDGVPAFRIMGLLFLPAAVSIILGAGFQSMGAPLVSLTLALFRQVIIVFPLAILFGMWFGPTAIWFSMVLAEVIPCLFAIPYFKRFFHKATDGMLPPAP